MRSYGAKGLRDYIRKQVKLAEEFHQMLSLNDRFEFPVPPAMGLVCFRLKVQNIVDWILNVATVWIFFSDFLLILSGRK
jgi:glutamate/tyrosine decarboxylase-like PLP-dependent enzyme